MTNCELCYEPLETYNHGARIDNDGTVHIVCDGARSDRKIDGYCIACGKEQAEDWMDNRCRTCYWDKKPFVGYTSDSEFLD